MDEKKAYWFEQPYMPRMKNIAVAPVILEDGRLSFCVPGDDGPPWSGVWNLTGKAVLDGDDYFVSDNIHPFSCLGDSEILAVKHFPFDMVPQFRKRTEDGAKRPAFVMR